MPAHAVGEDRDAELGVGRDAVLVKLAHAADVGERGDFDELMRHPAQAFECTIRTCVTSAETNALGESKYHMPAVVKSSVGRCHPRIGNTLTGLDPKPKVRHRAPAFPVERVTWTHRPCCSSN